MPYNFYIQVVFIKEDRLSIRHAVPEILDFKERDGVGSGREYSDFSLKYERTRCARSLVIICWKTVGTLLVFLFSCSRDVFDTNDIHFLLK